VANVVVHGGTAIAGSNAGQAGLYKASLIIIIIITHTMLHHTAHHHTQAHQNLLGCRLWQAHAGMRAQLALGAQLQINCSSDMVRWPSARQPAGSLSTLTQRLVCGAGLLHGHLAGL
jgi:hypothetical protein